MTIEKHKRIDERFLNNKVRPRIIIFMADGTNLSKKNFEKHDVAIFENRGPNNVAINVNKYIAKYDFEIARKLKTDTDRDANKSANTNGEEEDERDEEEVRQKFMTNAILEILQVCSNELA